MTRAAGLLALSFSLMSRAVAATELLASEPRVEKNPNPRAPLAAVLRLDARKPVAVRLGISDGRRDWAVEYPRGASGPMSLPIAGMKADRTHRFKVTAIDASGNAESADVAAAYRTPPLPTAPFDFPRLELVRSSPGLEPGITLMTVRRRALGRPHTMTQAQREFGTEWSLIVAVDAQGEIVWYYQGDRRIAGIAPLPNGNIFYHSHGSVPTEIDLLGNRVRQWGAALGPVPVPAGAVPVEAITLHHQPDQLQNGNFLSMMAAPRTVENYYTSELDAGAPRKAQKVMGDDIIEFTPEGKVVWRWSAWDHLDPFRIGYETFSPYWWVRGFPDTLDWTHGNGVHYDRRDDSAIMSFRNQDAILKVDRKSGQIKWILGRDVGWGPAQRAKLLRPVGANFVWPSHQHNPRVTDRGTVIVFNNNVFQAHPFTGEPIVAPEKSFSNAIEYEIDEQAMTARVVFVTPAEGCQSWAMGDAHRLPATGHVLIAYSLCYPGLKLETFTTLDRSRVHPDDLPVTPKVVEYSRDDPPKRLWELTMRPPHDLIQWEVYGVYRIPSMHFGKGDAARTLR